MGMEPSEELGRTGDGVRDVPASVRGEEIVCTLQEPIIWSLAQFRAVGRISVDGMKES